MMRRHGARIAFTQHEDDYWTARFTYTRGVYDRRDDEPAQMTCSIYYTSGERYALTTQGGKPGGRRYREFATFDQARVVAEKWAARRFYTL